MDSEHEHNEQCYTFGCFIQELSPNKDNYIDVFIINIVN